MRGDPERLLLSQFALPPFAPDVLLSFVVPPFIAYAVTYALLTWIAGYGMHLFLRDSLRLAGSSYATWRDIVLTNQEVLSAALDLLARRLDDLRERLASRDLEADFDAANELYKLLRSL